MIFRFHTQMWWKLHDPIANCLVNRKKNEEHTMTAITAFDPSSLRKPCKTRVLTKYRQSP
uniref:Uncharacterized protein n=1 Tax=Candidatus Kentrum sp. DK TaxID=2126562 RepID=A0A450S6C9_9GAMM|nr:MAG: hypothetical protein BECKDK2373C_GA0170839_101830 [Candidatus Kentron sp. DK]